MRVTLGLFLLLALLASALQAARLYRVPILDVPVWSDQAAFVLSGDVRAFDTAKAYGHPGGPLILGGIFFEALPLLSDYDAFVLFLSIANGILVAGIAVLCYVLRRSWWWGGAAFLTLSLHASYAASTPPSLLAAYLAVLLTLLTLLLVERGAQRWALLFWSLVAGLLVSTRFDIGTLLAGAYGILLAARMGWKRVSLLALGAAATFFATDPFLWSMPLRHVGDLFYKVFYHYAEFPFPVELPLLLVLQFSAFALAGIGMSSLALALPSRAGRVLPLPFLGTLYAVTAALVAVFATATIQTERYFLPLLFIWETFLPLFLFHLIDQTAWSTRVQNACKAACILALMAYPLLFLVCFYANPSGPTCTI